MVYPSTELPSLFTAQDRADPTPKREGETRFGFLDRVSGPFWDRLRSMLDLWFCAYPSLHAGDLRARIQSGDDQLDAAWWELYLHQILIGTGRRVEVHPKVPESSAHPDFLVIEPDGGSWYLEARLLQDADAAEQRRTGQILDCLNTVRSPNFFVAVSFRQVGASTPSLTRLRAEVARWLDTLDADAVLAAVESADLSAGEIPSKRWGSGDWSILFQAIPKRREARGRAGGRTVGYHSGPGGRWVGEDIGRLEVALSEKAKKYGDLPHPLVLALRMTSPYVVPAHLLRERSGVESGMAGAGSLFAGATARRRVSALVLAGPELQPVSVCSVTPILAINGSAERPLSASLPFPVVATGVSIDDAERSPLAELDGVLRLPSDFRALKQCPFAREP